MKRISSIDITRGLAMVIMALDHVRDLIHADSLTQSPTDLLTTTPILFFTRFITHLCAPIFVFLAGTSVYISFKKQNDIYNTRRFLFKRGLWLILLEFTIINFGIFGDPRFHVITFLVVAAIGFGFIMLSLLLHVSPRVLGILGLAIIFFHNLLPIFLVLDGSLAQQIVNPFFGPAAFPLTPLNTLIVGYPPIPWLGIMLAGYGAGPLFLKDASARRSLFIKIGAITLIFFIILRWTNLYGDPVPWRSSQNSVYTFLSFMNITKYPPSLLFCAFTLGTMFLILALAENAGKRTEAFLTVYGQVPMFYFIVHFYVIHLLLIFILFIQGFQWQELDFSLGTFGRPKLLPSGLGLGLVYIIWIFVVLLLYKPCKWYGGYKKTHNDWWLKYL